jgi:hypothetical protein
MPEAAPLPNAWIVDIINDFIATAPENDFTGYGCGLCQVGVPCEAGIPVKAAREALERGELPPPPPPLA